MQKMINIADASDEDDDEWTFSLAGQSWSVASRCKKRAR